MATRKSPSLAGQPKNVTIAGELNDTHKRFAKAYVLRGRNAVKAGREVGYDPWHSQQVRHDPKVNKLIEEYTKVLEVKFDLTEERIITELVRIGFSNISDFLRIKDGKPILDLSDISDDQLAAIASVEQDEYTDWVGTERGEEGRPVKKTRFKFHPKMDALQSIIRIRGMYKDLTAMKVDEDEIATKVREALKAMLITDGVKGTK